MEPLSDREEVGKIQSQNMPKSQPFSKEEKADQILEAKDDTFWETQPAGQFNDIGDASLPEGPIEPRTPLSEVKQEPYGLPLLYEWTTCDMNSEDVRSKVYKFLEKNYPDAEYNFKVNYSKEFLRWALCPPGYDQSWNVGVCVKASKILVGFVSGVPARIRVLGEVVKMAKVNFLCVHRKNCRGKRLAATMIKELTRRIQLRDIWQAIYSSLDQLRPKPVTTCQYWVRMLNPAKLIDLQFFGVGERMTKNRAVKIYGLPEAPITPGFREMEQSNVCSVARLLRDYLSQFGVATEFDENDVEHWLLPRNDIVHSYLVVNPETREVTDFCSFYSVPYTIAGNPKYTTVECAYSFYNVATSISFPQLMKDALIVSKNKGFDVFYALDVMHNESFLKELKFKEGAAQTHYYLHNYSLRSAQKPSELGLVLL